jgi:hypothetical protein
MLAFCMINKKIHMVSLMAATWLLWGNNEIGFAEEIQSEIPVNLCIINRLPDKTSKIVGIYVTCASRRPLHGNKQIDWSENFLDSPLLNGGAAELGVDCTNYSCIDIRIDIKTGDKSDQYFHRSAHMPGEGQILHKAIVSVNDGSAKWKVSKDIDKNFGK